MADGTPLTMNNETNSDGEGSKEILPIALEKVYIEDRLDNVPEDGADAGLSAREGDIEGAGNQQQTSKKSAFEIIGIETKSSSSQKHNDGDADSLDEAEEGHFDEFPHDAIDGLDGSVLSDTESKDDTDVEEESPLTGSLPDNSSHQAGGIHLNPVPSDASASSRFRVVKVHKPNQYARGGWKCVDYYEENEKSDVISTVSAVPAAAVSTKGTDSGGSSRASSVHYLHGTDDVSKNPLTLQGAGSAFSVGVNASVQVTQHASDIPATAISSNPTTNNSDVVSTNYSTSTPAVAPNASLQQNPFEGSMSYSDPNVANRSNQKPPSPSAVDLPAQLTFSQPSVSVTPGVMSADSLAMPAINGSSNAQVSGNASLGIVHETAQSSQEFVSSRGGVGEASGQQQQFHQPPQVSGQELPQQQQPGQVPSHQGQQLQQQQLPHGQQMQQQSGQQLQQHHQQSRGGETPHQQSQSQLLPQQPHAQSLPGQQQSQAQPVQTQAQGESIQQQQPPSMGQQVQQQLNQDSQQQHQSQLPQVQQQQSQQLPSGSQQQQQQLLQGQHLLQPQAQPQTQPQALPQEQPQEPTQSQVQAQEQAQPQAQPQTQSQEQQQQSVSSEQQIQQPTSSADQQPQRISQESENGRDSSEDVQPLTNTSSSVAGPSTSSSEEPVTIVGGAENMSDRESGEESGSVTSAESNIPTFPSSPLDGPTSKLAAKLGTLKGEDDKEEDAGTGSADIDNKIEQAMDLVKSHLMYAVREEVDDLKQEIVALRDRNSRLEYENSVLKSYAPQDVLSQLSNTSTPPAPVQAPTNNSSSSGGNVALTGQATAQESTAPQQQQ